MSDETHEAYITERFEILLSNGKIISEGLNDSLNDAIHQTFKKQNENLKAILEGRPLPYPPPPPPTGPYRSVILEVEVEFRPGEVEDIAGFCDAVEQAVKDIDDVHITYATIIDEDREP